MSVLNQLLNAYHNKRLSHLYILSGVKGSGKKQTTIDFLSFLLKNEHQDEERTKTLISENQHVNVIWLQPDGLSVKKEQIINLQNEFSKTSLSSGYRAFVIERADLLTLSAANSLLKFLEEPSNHQIIGFLLTDNIASMIETIISRSQVIHMPYISEAVLLEGLLEDETDPLLAFYLAGVTKDIDEARTLKNDPVIQEMLEAVSFILTNWSHKNISFSLYYLDKFGMFMQSREALTIFLNGLLNVMMDIYKFQGKLAYRLDSLKAIYQTIANTLEKERLMMLIETLKRMIEQQRYYVNSESTLLMLIRYLDKERRL